MTPSVAAVRIGAGLLLLLLSACAPPLPITEVARESPNARVDTNFERCVQSYADVRDSIEGGAARIQQLCRQGAIQVAATTQSDLSRLRRDEEVERRRLQAERDQMLAEARRAAREEQAREQAEFDRSSLGRVLNAVTGAMEARLERQTQPTPPSGTRDGCAGSEPMFVYREQRSEWEARCGRQSRQRGELPSAGGQNPNARAGAGSPVTTTTGPSVQQQGPVRPPISAAVAPPSRDGPGPVVNENPVVNCVRLDTSTGAAVFKNDCPTRVNVSYCVENAKHVVFNCRGRFQGTKSLFAQESDNIPDYKYYGGGYVRFGACTHPHTAADLDVAQNTYRCTR